MRVLVFGLFVVTVSPIRAADKDEEKAKEVASAFLKALVAKDVEAVMKTVDAPFTFDVGTSTAVTVNKADELKSKMAEFVKEIEPDLISDIKVEKVYDMKAAAKYTKDTDGEEKGQKFVEIAEKLVGKSGYMVVIAGKDGKQTPGMLIRIKEGKALIASLPR